MRMWMVPAHLLCKEHLMGEHLDLHIFIGRLRMGANLVTYCERNLFEPQSLKSRHDELVQEMVRRGYSHNSPMQDLQLPEQLTQYKMDVDCAHRDLTNRCKKCKSLQEGNKNEKERDRSV